MHDGKNRTGAGGKKEGSMGEDVCSSRDGRYPIGSGILEPRKIKRSRSRGPPIDKRGMLRGSLSGERGRAGSEIG